MSLIFNLTTINASNSTKVLLKAETLNVETHDKKFDWNLFEENS